MTRTTRKIRNLSGLLGLTGALLALGAAPALAAPELDVTLSRDLGPDDMFETVRHSDQRVDFTVNVGNTATEAPPAVGDTVRCIGEPPERSWSGNPVPTFSYQWTRNGEPIAGATSTTYTATSADEGGALQCVVTGANDVDAEDPPENVTVKSSVASAPLLVPPEPSPLPPTAQDGGGWRPSISGSGATGTRICTPPVGTTASAVADLTSGSTALETVTTSRGFGVVDPDTSLTEVISVNVGGGRPFRVGQTVTIKDNTIGDPPPLTAPDTTITAVDEANHSFEISSPVDPSLSVFDGTVGGRVRAGSQPFSVGEEIFGEGIPAGTEIAAIDGMEITLDTPATITKSEVVVSSASTGTWSFQWLRNGAPIAGATGSEYTPGAADENVVLQCRMVGTTGTGGPPDGGALVGISDNSFTGALGTTSPAQELPEPEGSSTPFGFSDLPFVASPNYASDLTLELELPGGEDTRAFDAIGNDWVCEALPAAGSQPARAACESAALLEPGGELGALTVVTELGADTPDLAEASVTVSGGGAAPASDELSFPIEPALSFGFTDFTAPMRDDAGDEYTQAGGHPFDLVSGLTLTQLRPLVPPSSLGLFRTIEDLKRMSVDAPPGVVGNPRAIPELCSGVDAIRQSECPEESLIGGIDLVLLDLRAHNLPVFAIEPEAGVPAQLAFTDPLSNVYVLSARLRPQDGYAISVDVAPSPNVGLRSAEMTLCDYGADSTGTGFTFGGCKGADDSGANDRPFLTAPTRCNVPLETRVRANSYTDSTFVEGPPFENESVTGCEDVPFDPEISIRPTTNRADSPTGLDVELTVPTDGLEDPDLFSQAHLRDAKVTLPEGLAVNPAGANGLDACSEEEVGISHAGVANDDPVRCPDASKIGSVRVTTPLLEERLEGSVYQAAQDDNPFNSTLAIYVVAESKERGVLVKLAGKVELDQSTGQITSTFTDNPQMPFEGFEFEFFGGATAPLRTPEACGSYSTESVLTPWSAPDSGPPVTDTDTHSITQAAGGGDCPTSREDLPNSPDVDAGTVRPIAGAHSPFVLDLRREDGTQRFSQVTLSPPPGLTAKLAGIPYCSDAALAAAEDREGRDEQADSSCPAASRIGSVHAAAGAGPQPYWTRGDAYLAGPYKGAPLSIALITPAVAGPFDLGVVVIRTALHVNPVTARITAVSDAIPKMLEGIPLDVRRAIVRLDRDEFTLNPTSCAEKEIGGELLSTTGGSAMISERFQLGECRRLGFKPRLHLRLFGKRFARSSNPRLRAVLVPRPGDANIAFASVRMPNSIFLDQDHIRTVCTRAQFATDTCPQRSVYGFVAARTPLLSEPLRGPIYLRSSDNPLPDLVGDLRGQVRIEGIGRTDSVKGALRNTFDFVPDAPISAVVINLQAGNKSLLVASRHLCAGPQRALVHMRAHNGRVMRARQRINIPRCRAFRKAARRKAIRRKRARQRARNRGGQRRARRASISAARQAGDRAGLAVAQRTG